MFGKSRLFEPACTYTTIGISYMIHTFRIVKKLYQLCESCNSSSELCNTLSVRTYHLCYVKILSQLALTKMNTTGMQGNWNETKGKLKQKFAILTDNDVLLLEGKKEEMLGKLQIKLGKTKEELQKIISEL